MKGIYHISFNHLFKQLHKRIFRQSMVKLLHSRSNIYPAFPPSYQLIISGQQNQQLRSQFIHSIQLDEQQYYVIHHHHDMILNVSQQVQKKLIKCQTTTSVRVGTFRNYSEVITTLQVDSLNILAILVLLFKE